MEARHAGAMRHGVDPRRPEPRHDLRGLAVVRPPHHRAQQMPLRAGQGPRADARLAQVGDQQQRLDDARALHRPVEVAAPQPPVGAHREGHRPGPRVRVRVRGAHARRPRRSEQRGGDERGQHGRKRPTARTIHEKAPAIFDRVRVARAVGATTRPTSRRIDLNAGCEGSQLAAVAATALVPAAAAQGATRTVTAGPPGKVKGTAEGRRRQRLLPQDRDGPRGRQGQVDDQRLPHRDVPEEGRQAAAVHQPRSGRRRSRASTTPPAPRSGSTASRASCSTSSARSPWPARATTARSSCPRAPRCPRASPSPTR